MLSPECFKAACRAAAFRLLVLVALTFEEMRTAGPGRQSEAAEGGSVLRRSPELAARAVPGWELDVRGVQTVSDERCSPLVC